jgi:uncharacterized protein YpmB
MNARKKRMWTWIASGLTVVVLVALAWAFPYAAGVYHKARNPALAALHAEVASTFQ